MNDIRIREVNISRDSRKTKKTKGIKDLFNAEKLSKNLFFGNLERSITAGPPITFECDISRYLLDKFSPQSDAVENA